MMRNALSGVLRAASFLITLLPLALFAAEPGARVVEPLSIQSVSQLILGLFLVIILILFLAWALRRVNAVPGQLGNLRVVASLPLGSRERAVLVQVGEEQLLLGVTSQSVTLLARYPEPILTPKEIAGGDFAAKFAKVLQQKGLIK